MFKPLDDDLFEHDLDDLEELPDLLDNDFDGPPDWRDYYDDD